MQIEAEQSVCPACGAEGLEIFPVLCYLPAVASCEETVLNVAWSCEPNELTTAMMATEMPAAIRPYSMAVAPDWSKRN
jgi:hypothetical protein